MFVFDPNRPLPVGLLTVLPNRPVVVPVFVEVFPAPPNNGVGLFCVCCVALPNRLPVVFVFGCVLPKIEVLPLGLAVLAFVVLPKSEVPGAVVVLVLAEGVPKIDDVPVVFVLLLLPKSEDPVAGWVVVLAPPKPPKIPPPDVPPPVFWFWLVLVDPNNPPPVALLVFPFVFPNSDGCVGCACSGLGVGFPAPKIEFPGFQVVRTCESELIQHTSVGKTRHRKCDRLLLFFGRTQEFCRDWERLKDLNSDKANYTLACLLRTYVLVSTVR